MAEWKKVIVSGSNISQLNNDSNYLTSGGSIDSASHVADAIKAVTVSNAQLTFEQFDGDTSNVTINNVANANTASYVAGANVDGDIAGNAGSATQLQNARTIGGVSFNGTANIDLPGVNTAGNQNTSGTAATASYVAGGNVDGDIDGKAATAGTADTASYVAVGNIDGEITATTASYVAGANVDGDIAGNAGSATQLQNARTIGGVSFNGTANIDLPGVNTAGNQNTSGTAATASYVAGGNVDGDIDGKAATAGTADTASYVAVGNIDGEITATTASYVAVGNIDGTIDISDQTNLATSNTSGQTGISMSLSGDTLSAQVTGLDTSDSPTFASLTLTGDLTVEGSQINAAVANLEVADRFILVNSGSTSNGDSGIIFGGSEGAGDSGSALIWDGSYNSNDGRLAVAAGVGSSDITATPAYYVAGVFEGNASDAATAQADHVGNIRVDSSDIYIYV